MTEPRRRTEYGPFFGQAAWSPDGRWIAYVRDSYPTHEYLEIFVMPADGGRARHVTYFLEQEPVWSPDGKWLALTVEGDRSVVHIIPFDKPPGDVGFKRAVTGGPCKITPDCFDSSPSWSPDGEWIAFVRTSQFGRRSKLWVVHPDGTALHELGGLQGIHPDWSPDGRQIAFADGGDIYVANADGLNPTRLTRGAERDYQPSWSPDGTAILFARGPRSQRTPGEGDVWIMNSDGSGERRLIKNATEPDWQPIVD